MLKIPVILMDPEHLNSSWLLVWSSLNIHQTWQTSAQGNNVLMSILHFNTFL